MSQEPDYQEWEINPDVSSAWNRSWEAAFQASRATGDIFALKAPDLNTVAERLGLPLYVRREKP